MRSFITIAFIIGISSLAFGQQKREVKSIDRSKTIQPVVTTPMNADGVKRTPVQTDPSKVLTPSQTEVANTNGKRRTQQPTEAGIIQSPKKD